MNILYLFDDWKYTTMVNSYTTLEKLSSPTYLQKGAVYIPVCIVFVFKRKMNNINISLELLGMHSCSQQQILERLALTLC